MREIEDCPQTEQKCGRKMSAFTINREGETKRNGERVNRSGSDCHCGKIGNNFLPSLPPSLSPPSPASRSTADDVLESSAPQQLLSTCRVPPPLQRRGSSERDRLRFSLLLLCSRPFHLRSPSIRNPSTLIKLASCIINPLLF